ncbi:MAG TPA: hypothetical protein VF313_02335 [Anaerolineaceae bacterium]
MRAHCHRANWREGHGSGDGVRCLLPFPRSVETAIKAGVTAIVHPSGSIRDGESIAAANAAGVAMVTTGVRHFRH